MTPTPASFAARLMRDRQAREALAASMKDAK